MWGHWPAPVPRQMPALLPGLPANIIQLFPLGAGRLESEARSFGLPNQTQLLGTAARARPFCHVLARTPEDPGIPLAPCAGTNRANRDLC